MRKPYGQFDNNLWSLDDFFEDPPLPNAERKLMFRKEKCVKTLVRIFYMRLCSSKRSLVSAFPLERQKKPSKQIDK